MKKIPLSQGKFALVSDEDFDLFGQLRWCASRESRGTKWYAIRWVKVDGKQTKIRLHCEIMGRAPKPTDGLVVHHKDDDGLNCQRENLEVITQSENMRLSRGWNRFRNPEPSL